MAHIKVSMPGYSGKRSQKQEISNLATYKSFLFVLFSFLSWRHMIRTHNSVRDDKVKGNHRNGDFQLEKRSGGELRGTSNAIQ